MAKEKNESATKNVPKIGIIEKKRKKKRSQAQIVKKFARQRNIGNLDKDVYQYLIRILDTLRTDFASVDDKAAFVNNVYEETVGHEVECARNQVASRVLDSLLHYASLEVIQRLLQAFEPSLRQLSNDKYASHVLQKVIVVCADRGNSTESIAIKTEIKNEEGITRDEDKDKDSKDNAIVKINPHEVPIYNDIVLKLSKYFLNNMEEFVFDSYANHVLRTVIQCLAGLIDTSSDTGKKFVLCPTSRRPVIQKYKDLLVQSCQRLQHWPQFCEFGLKDITSGLVQCILFSLKDVDANLMENLVDKILLQPMQNMENPSAIFNTESSVRLMEACLMTSEPKTFNNLYKTFFADNLEYLCQNQNSNYSVQRLLDSCIVKETFEEIFDKVVEHFPKILKRGFTGILLSTGNACLKLHAKQGTFVSAIMKMLDCTEGAQLIWCIATLNTRSQLEAAPSTEQPALNLHGSLITQAILKFNKPIKIVNSLLEMSNEKLLQLCDDPKGSRILDAFMDSEYVGEKSRDKLYKKLQGIWADLARGKHGSRCVDKMWEKTNARRQTLIMEELAAAGESLRSTKSGQLISNKFNVPLFARDKNEWLSSQKKEQNTKKLFANIINKVPKK